MSGQAFLDRLKKQVRRQDHRREPRGDRSLDRSRARRPASRSASYLRDEPDLRFDMLNCISGVDYFEPDAKKAAKVDWQPHVEVVYHLSSMHAQAQPGAQGDAAALEGRQAGRAARGAHRSAASGARPTGTSAKSSTCRACASPAIPTCGASSAPKTGSAIRCAKTTKCRWNTTASAAVNARIRTSLT